MKKLVSVVLSTLLAFALVPLATQPANAATEGDFTPLVDVDYSTYGNPSSNGVRDNSGNFYWTTWGNSTNLWVYNVTSGTNTLVHGFASDNSEGKASQSRLVFDSANNEIWGTTKLGGTNYCVWNVGHTAQTCMDLGTIWKYDIDTATFSVVKTFDATTGGSIFEMTFDPVRRTLVGLGQISPTDFTTFTNGQMWSYNIDTAAFNHWEIPAGISGAWNPKMAYSTSTGLVYVAASNGSGAYFGGQIYSFDFSTGTFTAIKNYSSTDTFRTPTQITIDDSVSPPIMYIQTDAGEAGTTKGGISVMNLDGTGYLDIKAFASPVLTGPRGANGMGTLFRSGVFFYGCRAYFVEPYLMPNADTTGYSAGVVSLYREKVVQDDWASFDQATASTFYGYGDVQFDSSDLSIISAGVYGIHQYKLKTANQHCNYAKAKADDVTVDYGADTSNLDYTVDPTTPIASWATPPTCAAYASQASTTALTGTLDAGTYVIKCSGFALGASETYENVLFQSGTLTVNKITPTVTYTGPKWILQGTGKLLGNAVTISPAACALPLRWSMSPKPVNTPGYMPYYPVASDNVDTLNPGTYTITAYVNQSFNIAQNNPNCEPATKATTVVIAPVGSTPPLPGVTVTPPASQNYNYGSTPSLNLTATATLDSDSSAFTDWSNGGSAPSCAVYTDGTYATQVTPSATTAAGSYVIHCTAAVDTTAYTLSVGADTTLTVNKVALTVNPGNKSIVAGSSVPASSFYTPSYSGFVNSQTAANLTTAPTCGTTYTTLSASGTTLPITCSGGVSGNYTFTYNSATLSIIDPTVFVVPTGYNLTYGDAVPAYAFTYYEDAGHTTVATPTVITAPTCTSSYTTTTAVSASPLTITCSGGSLGGGYTLNTTATSQVTVAKLSATLAYNGDTTKTAARGATSATVNLSASLSPGTGTCAVSWTLTDANLTTFGPYTADSSAGAASYSVDLPIGVYTVATEVTGNCTTQTDTDTLTISVAKPSVTPPLAPTATAGDGQATVTVHPNGPAAQSYLVYSYPGGFSCTVYSPATSCVVTGLTNGTEYVFYSRAINDGEASMDSPASNPVTPQAAPKAPLTPPAPTVEPGDGQAKVTPHANSGGPAATKYIITAGPDGGNCEVVAPATSCVITGLTNGKQYQFTTVAVNTDGSSPTSPAAPGTPFAPAATGGAKEITVDVVPPTDGQAPDSYIATAQPSGASCLIKAPATSCVITGLKADTKYQITVESFDKAGKAISKSVREARTNAGSGGSAETGGKKVSVKIAPFAGGKSALTKALKAQLNKLAKRIAKAGASSITCAGSTSGPTVKASDRKLALNRAYAACNYLKGKVKTLTEFNVEAKTTKINAANIRRVVVSFSTN